MKGLAKRIRNSNQQYFDAGVKAGAQKMCDLFPVALHESGLIRTPAKAKELMALVSDLDAEYGIAWKGESESDEAIAKIDYVLKKLCGDAFQPFFERNDLILDWWERGGNRGAN